MSPLKPFTRGPKATLSKIDLGNGLGFWKTMPMRRRTSTGSTYDAYRFSSWYVTSPSSRVPGIRSFIRLMVRRSVDLPHPDGPISAVISLGAISMEMSFTARNDP